MSRAAAPMTPRQEWLRRTALHSAILAGLIFAAYLFTVVAIQKGAVAYDVVAYWHIDLANPYHGTIGALGFFAYSPPIALVLAPFGALPWIVFVTGWYLLLAASLVYLGGSQTLMLLAFPPVAIELYEGNIHLLIAAAVVLGFRFPAVWSFVLLTKVTPGIGLLWFAVRREWRSLAWALGATGLIVLVTWVFLPSQWAGFVSMLAQSAGSPPGWPALPIPLWLRLPIAAAIVWWGARRGRPWTVAFAAAISVPALWPGALSILVACWPLRRQVDKGQVPTRGYHAANAGGPRTEPQQAAA
jgi:Glycosyltransferase family 87